MRLAEKVAVITGAGSGFGRAAAELFAREGAQVVLADINAEAGRAVVETIQSNGGQATFVETNVTIAADVERMIATAVQRYGRLNVLLNNAGIWFPRAVEEMTEAEWDRMIDVNLKSVWLGCKFAIPEMRRAGGGSIVNTASGGGLVGSRTSPAYSAAKGGVVIFTKAVALAVAKDNIRVNSICPSVVATNLYTAGGVPREQVETGWVGAIPMGRLGTPEEIANAMLYLASDESSFVTGTALSVDGGLTAQ